MGLDGGLGGNVGLEHGSVWGRAGRGACNKVAER